jgi:hypothetical protein
LLPHSAAVATRAADPRERETEVMYVPRNGGTRPFRGHQPKNMILI